MGISSAVIGLIVSTVAGVGTTIYQASEGKKAQKKEERAKEVAGNQEKINQINETRKAVRERRIRAAALEQQSDTQGTQGSSGELGALGGLSGDTNSAIGTATGQGRANDAITDLRQGAADHRQNQNTAGAINSVFQTGANAYSKTNGFKSIFS